MTWLHLKFKQLLHLLLLMCKPINNKMKEKWSKINNNDDVTF